MNYRSDKLMIDGHTDTHTHAGNDNTRRPKLASGKNVTVSWNLYSKKTSEWVIKFNKNKNMDTIYNQC